VPVEVRENLESDLNSLAVLARPAALEHLHNAFCLHLCLNFRTQTLAKFPPKLVFEFFFISKLTQVVA
jgi:hypothetical protein